MFLDKIKNIVPTFARVGAWCGGAMMLLAAMIVCAEVVLRKIFLISLGGADEMASYALAIGTTWALSFALIERAHIRVDGLNMLLPRRLGSLLDIISLLSMLLFTLILSYYGVGVVITSWNYSATANTPLGTPLWIPQGLWVFGLLMFVLTIVVLLVRTTHAISHGDFIKAHRIAGAKGAKNEVKEEISEIVQSTSNIKK